MKTVFISDIHVDENKNYDVVGCLVSYLKEEQAELLVLAGDISGAWQLTQAVVRDLEERSGVEVVYVPGNHDMWNHEREHIRNDEIYQHYLNDSHCLSRAPRRVGSYVLIGDIGWYDYSFGNPVIPTAEFEKMQKDGRVWQDSRWNDWTEDNKKKSEWFLDKLASQMEEWKNTPQVLVTHMLPAEAFCVPISENNELDWGYFNAFLGTKKLKELYQRYPVKYAVCGHVHFRASYDEGGTHWMCRCLNYEREWRGEKDCLAQIRAAAEVVEL